MNQINLVPPRMAVTGTGRCGTGYIAELLRRHGLQTGHEWWWRGGIGSRVGGLDIDVSWLALPDIESGAWSGPVVHLVRDPVDTVRSFIRTRFFHAENRSAPFVRFALRHCPEARLLNPIEAAVEWWVHWNDRCAAAADLTVRLEDLPNPTTLESLGDALGGIELNTAAAAGIPADTNHTPRGMNPTKLLAGRADAAAVTAMGVWALIAGRAAHGYAHGPRASV